MKNFYRDGGLVVSVIALIVTIVALSGFIFMYKPTMFWLLAPIIVLVSGFAIGKLIQVTRRTFQYFALITQEIDQISKLSLYNFPLSVVIIDSARKMVWFNSSFVKAFGSEAAYGNTIDIITGDSIKSLLERDGTDISHNGRYYRAFANVPADSSEGDVFLIYFKDMTDYRLMQIEQKMSHPVVIIFMIDSYDEMFSGNLESETAHVTVQIDRLLEDFVAETTGILRKSGRDRFWAVIEERHVAKMIEGKIKILDRAREIQVTDRINVTLSIGIGRTGKNISESESYAKQALDMALGRGGDQAAIKTVSGFEFYGGVSKGIERQTKVKTRIIANSLLQVVDSADCVYIMGHKFSDLDSIGSSVGLTCAIRNLGKEAYAVVDSVASLGTQLIARMNEANDKPSIFLTPADAVSEITENSLLIIVDTHNPALLESTELHSKAQKVVIIDHHRKMVNHIDNAVIFHHEPYASSASEMVAELLSYFGNAGKLTALQAEALLAGIMLDTKNFTIKTGVRTFEAAAFLRKLGADTINVKGLFANSIDSYKQKAMLVADADIYKRCAIASSDAVSATMRLIAPQAADELLGISGVDASFVFYRTGSDEIYISARSLGALNVQLIMESLGGGGHQTMAGAQLKGFSMTETKKRLYEAVDKYYESLS